MLSYSSEVVIPVEVNLHSHQRTTFQEVLNDVALHKVMDMPYHATTFTCGQPSITSEPLGTITSGSNSDNST